METFDAKVNALNRFNKKNNDFIRRFNAGVKTIEMDARKTFDSKRFNKSRKDK